MGLAQPAKGRKKPTCASRERREGGRGRGSRRRSGPGRIYIPGRQCPVDGARVQTSIANVRAALLGVMADFSLVRLPQSKQLQICRNCNDMFEDAFAQARIEHCAALMNCARQLIEEAPVGCNAEMAQVHQLSRLNDCHVRTRCVYIPSARSRCSLAQVSTDACVGAFESGALQLAARTWTNIGLLHSRNGEMHEAVDSFGKALSSRMGTRDTVAVASAHANLALALADTENSETALEHARLGLNICLDVLDLGSSDTIHTLGDDDIPQGNDSQPLLRILAACLLVQGSVQEELGRECLTSYQPAMLVARHLSAGSESLAEKIHERYAKILQQELSRTCSTRDDTMFHSKLFLTPKKVKGIPTTALQHEIAAGRTGKTSRRFLVGTELEFYGPRKIKELRTGLPLQSKHLRNVANSCALTLQCAVRCHRARNGFSRWLQLLPFNRHQALRIQAVFRGHLARRCAQARLRQTRVSSAIFLQACMQRRLQHDALLRRLFLEAKSHVVIVPSSHEIHVRTSSPAVTARCLVIAAGFSTNVKLTVSMHVLDDCVPVRACGRAYACVHLWAYACGMCMRDCAM